jgi:hypothetical protein
MTIWLTATATRVREQYFNATFEAIAIAKQWRP